MCDVSCNTSACFWDSGDCGYLGAVLGAVLGGAREPICNTGCPVSWRDDGECDEACFNAACSWDADDCTPAREGCSDGCVPSWLEDDECDESDERTRTEMKGANHVAHFAITTG